MQFINILFYLVLSSPAALSSGKGQKCNFERPASCEEVQFSGFNKSGIYRVFPDTVAEEGREVYCDLITGGGGWTVIQRRTETTVNDMDFFRDWNDYAFGFGSLDDNFWLGLDLIADLTKEGDKELRFELSDWEEQSKFAEYSSFQVADASALYQLSVDGYSGNANDSFSAQNGMKFTTKDKDNDEREGQNCALVYEGAWWYKNCHSSNLNGRYLRGEHATYANGVNWYHWHGHNYSLKRTEMKIRGRYFNCFKEAQGYYC